MSKVRPTDEEILDILRHRGSQMTYVVKNYLRDKYRDIKTPWVLRRLKALEKAGKVRRMPTSYQVQIAWDLV